MIPDDQPSTSPPSAPPPSDPPPASRHRFRARWLLLALPYLALCFPQLYARNTPVLFGFPFFYWYQFVWVVLTSLLLLLYYRLNKSAS